MVKKIPKEFEEDYMKYYNGEISNEELSKKYGVHRTTIWSWRSKLNLPVKILERKIPNTFKEDYMEYYYGTTSYLELCKKYNVTEGTVRNWRNNLSLPPIHRKSKKVMDNSYTSLMKSATKFKLFGYEFTLGMKKIEPPKPVDMTDELEDFIEY